MPDQPPGKNPPKPPVPVAPPATIDELLERAEDRLIARGSTVRISPDNPDVQSPAQIDEVTDTLTACGITLVRDPAVGKTEIRIEPPAPKK